MMPSSPVCLFTEGCVVMPEGYTDRTVNAFTPPGDGPAFTLARDVLKEGELLSAYIDRQLATLEQNLTKWVIRARSEVQAGEGLLTGECIEASYLRGGQRIWQQQAVFALESGMVLVFTMSKTDPLDDADSARLATLLGSFRFHQ